MPPGFVCVIKTCQNADGAKAVLELDQLIFPEDLFETTNIADFNHLLFKCDQEELDITKGKRGTYAISGH